MIDCAKIAKEIKDQGISVVRNMINPLIINHVKNQVDEMFLRGEHLGEAVNVSSLRAEHLRICGEERDTIKQQYDHFYLNKQDFDKGIDHLRKFTNGIGIVNPLSSIKDLWKIVIMHEFLQISFLYFEEKSHLGFVKVRRFFVNKLPMFDTNYFHIDDNGSKLLKAIIFLNDIDEQSGPFVFVSGSHKNVMPNELTTYRYSRTDEEINNYYGRDQIMKITGNCGDVVFVDTLGVHRGEKPITHDRNVCFVNFVVEEEYGGKGKKMEMSRHIFEELTNELKDFGKYIQLI